MLQGAFVLAKTQEPDEAAELAREAIGHLRRYFELLFSARGDQADRQALKCRRHAMPKMIFVNLPVTDLPRSMAFYAALGFTNEPDISPMRPAACMV